MCFLVVFSDDLSAISLGLLLANPKSLSWQLMPKHLIKNEYLIHWIEVLPIDNPIADSV